LVELGAFPTRAEEISPELLETLIGTLHPGCSVRNVTVKKVWEWGQGEAVSTSGRIDLTLHYGASSGDLPSELVLKIARPELPAFPLYRNEVAIYSHVRPWTFMQAPRCLGAWFDDSTGSFGLLLEDLTSDGATFCSAVASPPVEVLERGVRELARLHGRFWGTRADWASPSLRWVQSHVAGDLHDLFNHPDLVPRMIEDEVAKIQHNEPVQHPWRLHHLETRMETWQTRARSSRPRSGIQMS